MNGEEDGTGRRPHFQTARITPFSDRRRQIIGKSITEDGVQTVIVGVLPPSVAAQAKAHRRSIRPLCA